MNRNRTMAVALWAFLCSSSSVLLAASSPAVLKNIDPLTQPAPVLSRPLQVERDQASSPEEKIVFPIRPKGIATQSDDTLSVVVVLHEPILADLASGPLDGEAVDAVRVQHLTALEQRFAREAADVGFAAGSGLSHMPIVFGRIARSRLVDLARLDVVKAIQEEQVYHALDTEGGDLTKGTQLRSQFSARGTGIGVAVLDSGIDMTHPEFGSRVVAYGNYVGGSSGQDDEGHGTESAGIIAGAIQGMAPAASLWAIKVLDANGSSTSGSVLNGMNAVYSNRNSFGGVRIVNMSLGGGGPFNTNCDALLPAEATAVNQLVAAGIAVIVSSGNDGYGNGVSQPACLSNALSVGAVYDANIGGAAFSNCTDETTAADQIPCYSNSGNPLDVLAPSHCATTAKLGGGFATCFGGTSAAAPYVSGAAAQILSLRPQTTPAQLQTAFMGTGRPVRDVNDITRNRIDALAAYQSLAGGSTGPCTPNSTTACMLNGRFRVSVRYRNGFDNSPADSNASVKPVTGFATPGFETAFFYFNSEGNIEMMVKILDQGNTNSAGQQTIAVLFGSATPLRVDLTITDTQRGATKTYSSGFLEMKGATDFTAFVK